MDDAMTCAEAREALLVADAAELDAGAGGPLPAHLRSCAACRQEAAAILEGTASLRAAIGTIVAERTERASSADARSVAFRMRRPRLLLPLALAATLAALLAVERGVIPLRGATPPADVYHPEPVVPTAPVVNAVEGSGVAVMRTSDPRITIVWNF